MSATVEDIASRAIDRAKADPANAKPPPTGSLYYPQRDGRSATAPSVPSSLLETAPGIVGSIARWIKRGDPDAPNGLCLLSALSVVSTVCGRRFMGPTGTPLSLQMASLVPSGGGKDWAHKAPNVLLQACASHEDNSLKITNPDIDDTDDQDPDDLLNVFSLVSTSPGNFTGDTAMIGALWRCPILLVRVDEFGDTLSQWTQSQSKEATIPALLRKAYTFGSVPPRAYAANTGAGKDLEEKRRKPLIDPFVTLFGVSTPKQFYSALNGGLSENGTLNRFVIFDEQGSEPTLENILHKYLGEGSDAKKSAPTEYVQALIDIFNHGQTIAQGIAFAMTRPHSDRMNVFKQVEHVKVEFADNEREGRKWAEFSHARQLERFSSTGKDATDQQEGKANAIARSAENLARIAAIVAIGDTPDIANGVTPYIAASHLNWAIKFVELAEQHLKVIIGDKIEGEESEARQRQLNQLVSIYEDLLHNGRPGDREGMYVLKRAITQKVRGADRSQFSQALKAAIEDGLFISERRPTGKGKANAEYLLWNGELKKPE